MKSEIEEQRLGDLYCHDSKLNFLVWWRSLSEVDVSVILMSVMAMLYFLQFVDNNSQPNRSADSHEPTTYFISNVNTIQMPKKNVYHYSDCLSSR